MNLSSLLMLAVLFPFRGHAAEPPAMHSTTQLLVVTTADWNAVSGTLQRYERDGAEGRWHPVGQAIEIVVGKNGLGWGKGVVSLAELSVSNGDPVKKEGDGKAPAGVFSLNSAFGYASQKEPGWRMPYITLTPSVECVDDSSSRSYNRIVDRTSLTPDWKSSEQMRRSDELYRWGIVVDHNADPPRAGDGSCIFLHIWRGPRQGTVGCTAMPPEQIESLLAWLDPARKPLLVQLPQSQYNRVKRTWRLP